MLLLLGAWWVVAVAVALVVGIIDVAEDRVERQTI